MIRLLGVLDDLPIFRVCHTLAVLGYRFCTAMSHAMSHVMSQHALESRSKSASNLGAGVRFRRTVARAQVPRFNLLGAGILAGCMMFVYGLAQIGDKSAAAVAYDAILAQGPLSLIHI